MKLNVKRSHLSYFIILALCLLIIHTYYFNRAIDFGFKSASEINARHSDVKLPQPRRSQLVLAWTTFFRSNKSYDAIDCITTYDRKFLKSADAVIFHLRDVNRRDMPKLKVKGQKWILFNLESPVNSGSVENFNELAPLIDLTMTYRRDSNIFVPYGRLQKLEQPRTSIAPINFANKSKTIAWFVSHCQTESKREVIANIIRNHTDVDIYGSCGELTCSRQVDDYCYRMLSEQYKFYLSFENSICTDYVTEKLFKVMKYDVIPIVYGGADYASILPENSYIDVRNFSSIEKFISYIQYVGNDEKVYKSYFEWRKFYKVSNVNRNQALCDVLTSTDVVSRPYEIHHWWYTDGNCGQMKKPFI